MIIITGYSGSASVLKMRGASMAMTAQEIDTFIEMYESFFEPDKLDGKSEELIKELFSEAAGIRDCNEGEMEIRSFYFHAPKCSFEQYREINDDTGEALKKRYEKETDRWYKMDLHFHDVDRWHPEPFYGVFINDMLVLSVNHRNTKEWEEVDASEFINGLISIVRSVVRELKDGTYNDRINAELPYYMRWGVVSRKDYWDAFPEERRKYDFTDREMEVLREYSDEDVPIALTARKYYEACSICYEAAGMLTDGSHYTDTDEEHERYGGVTPKEAYYRFADGRDDDLRNVPLDSEEEFRKWLNHEEPYSRWGGHPFEIASYLIHLYVFNNALSLTAGSSYPADKITAKMYVGLRDHNIPVSYHAGALLNMIDEKDYVGLNPTYRMYMEEFPMDDIYDIGEIIYLDEKAYLKLKDRIKWAEIPMLIYEEVNDGNSENDGLLQ